MHGFDITVNASIELVFDKSFKNYQLIGTIGIEVFERNSTIHQTSFNFNIMNWKPPSNFNYIAEYLAKLTKLSFM